MTPRLALHPFDEPPQALLDDFWSHNYPQVPLQVPPGEEAWKRWSPGSPVSNLGLPFFFHRGLGPKIKNYLQGRGAKSDPPPKARSLLLNADSFYVFQKE